VASWARVRVIVRVRPFRELIWLKERLQAHPDKAKVVLLHHALYFQDKDSSVVSNYSETFDHREKNMYEMVF